MLYMLLEIILVWMHSFIHRSVVWTCVCCAVDGNASFIYQLLSSANSLILEIGVFMYV